MDHQIVTQKACRDITMISWKGNTCHFDGHLWHSRGTYSSAQNYCMLFNNPNSHRTVESLVMTLSENGRDLFQANFDSLLYDKFRGLWTKEWFFGKHEIRLYKKCEKRLCHWIPNDNVLACLKSQKNDHSSTNKSANLPKRQAIAGQRTVKLLLVLNDAHNPINNPWELYKLPMRANKAP